MRLKEQLKEIFPGLVSIRNRIYNYLAHYRFKNRSPREVFSAIYHENHWKDQESKSGPGSNKKNTQKVILVINKTIENLGIRSMLDIPCGDFQLMSQVSLKEVKYIGADIVEELIDANKKFNQTNREFISLDLMSSKLPKVDLIFCRDCLVHLSYKDIQRCVENIKSTGSTYLMTTTFTDHSNYDIITGDWRPINLQKHPFNFPEPMSVENESSLEDKRFADKSLAIWKIEAL